jgi:hypothetical protein
LSNASSSSRKKLFKENNHNYGQRSAFSIKYQFGNNYDLITPEKTKEIQKENVTKKIEGPIRSNYFNNNNNNQNNSNILNANMTTIDKTRR